MISRLAIIALFGSCLFVALKAAVAFQKEIETIIPRDKMGKKINRFATLKEDGSHVDEVTIRLNISGKPLELELVLNRNLLPKNFVQIFFTESGRTVAKKGMPNCYYHGRIAGLENSNAIISTCKGIKGVFYHGSKAKDYFYIEPAMDDGEDYLHVVYKADDLSATNLCGSGNGSTHRHTFADPIRTVSDEFSKRAQRVSRDITTQTKYLEFVIVNDRSQFAAAGGTVQAAGEKSIEFANIVDSLYKSQLNTRIILVAVMTWNIADQISVTSSAFTTLDLFSRYRRSNLVPTVNHDLAFLITAIDFDFSTVGVAHYNGACTSTSAVAVIHNTGFTQSTATTIAHEMGHSLGMAHDDDRSCDICPPDSICIMAGSSVIGHPPSLFSQCSEQDYSDFLEAGHGTCLFNIPTGTFAGPICGNGLIEDGEECDCGTSAECGQLNACCNITTCTLQPGVQCASGECCNTSQCTFLAQGVRCRENVTVCDLPEYCTGTSGKCPENIHMQDGTVCYDTVQSICYDGRCESAMRQCQQIWGASAANSASSCYTTLNTRGDEYGFCSTANGRYVSCESGSEQCGMLHCVGGSDSPSVTVPGGARATSRSLSLSATCKAVYALAGVDLVPEIGIAVDGTPCGNNKICVDKTCMNVSTLTEPCPQGENGEVCSGQGVCNSKNNCSCYEGFSPPNCTKTPTAGPTIAATMTLPTTAEATTTSPTTEGPSTAGPTTAKPTTIQPKTTNPPTPGGTTSGPTTSAPTTARRTATTSPTTTGPTTAEPSTDTPSLPTTAGGTTATQSVELKIQEADFRKQRTSNTFKTQTKRKASSEWQKDQPQPNVVTSMKNFLLVSLSLSNTNYCVSANKRIHPVPEQVHIYFREYSVGTFCCI
eukprot:m.21210 g.21210  ORF g.21210 m.21210 type:complete len:880 (+) comp28150_c0_seq3:291-2930(+)